MPITLPIAWIFAGILINILCCNTVYPLFKGLPSTFKTGKPLKTMPHVNAQKVLQNVYKCSFQKNFSPTSSTPAPKKVFGKKSLIDIL